MNNYLGHEYTYHSYEYTYLSFHYYLARGVGQALRITWNKLHSILRYAKVHREFTELKQVSARTIQVCRGTSGDQLLEHFCS